VARRDPDRGFSAALLLVFLLAGLWWTRYALVNLDEGWLLYASRLVYQGSLPYRDFPFFQAPLAPYVYGFFQQILGAGLDVGRWTSLAASLVTVALGIRIARGRGGRVAALIFVAGILSVPLMMWSLTTTRTEPLSLALLMSALFVALAERPSARLCALGIVAAALAAAVRLSLAPAGLLLIGLILWPRRAEAGRLGWMLAPAALLSLLALVPVFADPTAAWHETVTVQSERHAQLRAMAEWDAATFFVAKLRQLWMVKAFGWVPLGGIVAIACLRFLPAGCGVIALVAGVAYLPQLLPRATWVVYFAGVYPLVLLLVAIAVGQLWSSRPLRSERMAIAAGLGVALAVQLWIVSGDLRLRWGGGRVEIEALREVARAIAKQVPEPRKIATFDTYLAVEGELELPRGFEMSVFSYFPLRPESDAARYGLLTQGRLEEVLADPEVAAVALSDRAVSVLAERRIAPFRPRRPMTGEQLLRLLPILRDFRLAEVYPRFGQFRGPLYFLLRAPASPPSTGP